MQAAMWAPPLCASFPAFIFFLAAISGCVATGIQDIREVNAGTPVQKVVKLLTDLQTTVEEQYTKDASQAEAYATFCKEQARIKAGAIAKSEEEIKVMEADVADLTAKIGELNTRLGVISTEITKKEGEKKDAESARATELETYLKKAKEYSDAIKATKEAIEAMKASKVDMEDARVDAPVAAAAFVQEQSDPSADVLHKYILNVRAAAVNPDVEALRRAVSLVRHTAPDSPEKNYAYTYHANDILAVLRSLNVQFRDEKQTLDSEEATNRYDFNKKILSLSNEIDFLKQEESEKKSALMDAQGKLSETNEAKDAETTDKTSDTEFKADLETSCTNKAKQWETREQTLKDELTALKGAIATLEEGEVEKLYGANKKLTLVREKAAPKAAVKMTSKAPSTHFPRQQPPQKIMAKRSLSFLQVRGADSQQDKQEAVIRRVMQHLDTSAGRLRSSSLAALSLRVQAGEVGPDHFVKVRGIIKDLMAKLAADAAAEATQKGNCDTDMKAQLHLRDSNSAKMEEQNAIIAGKTAKRNELKEEISVLAVEIADLYKALNTTTELRLEESTENNKTIADAQSGQSTTEEAKQILKTFYDKHAFLQYKPPDSDRYDETVGDRAPEVFDNTTYKGQQASAKGILGLLDVITSDFQRTVTSVQAAEAQAVKDFNKYKEDTTGEITSKEADKKSKKDEVDNLTTDIQGAESELETATSSRDAALAQLEVLKTSCVQGEETYAERVAKREQEIAALKEALQILIDWKGF